MRLDFDLRPLGIREANRGLSADEIRSQRRMRALAFVSLALCAAGFIARAFHRDDLDWAVLVLMIGILPAMGARRTRGK